MNGAGSYNPASEMKAGQTCLKGTVSSVPGECFQPQPPAGPGNDKVLPSGLGGHRFFGARCVPPAFLPNRLGNDKVFPSSRARGSTLCLILLSVCSAFLTVRGSDWPQWRGPERNGTSKETGLLKEWPVEGPKLAWHLTDLGGGYSTPSVAQGRLYVVTSDGEESESVQALNAADGKKLWSTRIGKVGPNDARMNFAGSRSTPTVDGELLFALGSDGDLTGLETSSGKIRWQKNLRTEFGGQPGRWAYAESPLVDGDTLVCTPGGSTATLVGLHKKTGEVLWKCALPEGDEAAFASAIVVEADGTKQYVQLLQKGLVGVDAKTGKFLWRFAKATSRLGANIPTPVASDGAIYVASAGTGGGVVKLKVKGDGVEPEQLFFDAKMPTAIGGAVKVGDYLYGTTGQAMLCVDFKTGQVKWEERGLGTASLCYTDGRLYLHGENGQVALVEPSHESYREKGRFTPVDPPQRANPMMKSWTYPVVADGRLYLRDQGSLWCYAVK